MLVAAHVHRVADFFKGLQATDRQRSRDEQKSESSGASIGLKRGPYLAVVHLYSKVSDAMQTNLLDELHSYAERFSDKHCFFDDIVAYLDLLPEHNRNIFISDMHKRLIDDRVALKSDPTDRKRKQFWRKAASFAQCRMYIDGEISSQEAKERASNCLELFTSVCPENQTLQCSERGDGDALLIVAAQYLITAHEKTRDRQLLTDAVLILTFITQKGGENFQASLLLTRLYNHPEIGAVFEALASYDQLSVKQILLENVSHAITHDVVRYGAWSKGLNILASVVEMHDSHIRDAPDLTTFAFREHNYPKALEFLSFNERMARSQVRALAKEEMVCIREIGGRQFCDSLWLSTCF